MNPALPVLSALALTGVLLRRREIGPPLAVCGLAAMLLLAPALLLPDGVPSPAASLGSTPPWQATLDPERGNPNLIDVSAQIYPWLLHLRHELRAGRWPFWNPYQYSGTPYWANGQSAPLFPLHLVFAATPLQIGFLLLPWLRLVAGGVGAFLFARRLGASREGALLAAVVYPLSGAFTSYLLFPMANALALVPWVLLATEHLAASGRVAPLALAAGAQALAGHPETVLHTALLAALYLLARGSAGPPLRTWGRFAAGWVLAAAIGAVHLLPFAWNLLASSRWHAHEPGTYPPLAVLAALPLRLVLPELHGNPALGTWWGPYHYVGTAVYAGALALPLAAMGVGALRRDRRVLGALVILCFALAAAYQAPLLREALAAVPLLGRALHHRLRFGVDLGLAVLAGLGADRWRRGEGRAALAGGALVVGALLAAAWARCGAEWAARGLTGQELRWTVLVAGSALVLLVSVRLAPARRAALALLLVPVTAVELAAAHRPTNPVQRLGELYPETGAVQFLRGRPERIAATGDALRPNTASVYGLFDARGDDSVKLLHYERLQGNHLGPGHPTYFTPITDWESRWLDRLGVRWVLAAPRAGAPAAGWALAYDGPDARVFERPQAMPLVRLQQQGRRPAPRVARREPGRWEIDWASDRAALLTVAEAWEPGWRAAVNGERRPVERADDHLLGVRVGPGEGRLALWHRPPGLELGAALTALGLTGLGLAAWRERAR